MMVYFMQAKNIPSLRKKMTMHVFFLRKKSLCMFKYVFSYAYPFNK